jgi:hypothetical protein
MQSDMKLSLNINARCTQVTGAGMRPPVVQCLRLAVLHSAKSSIAAIEAERWPLREYLAVTDWTAHKMEMNQEG